MKPVVLFCPSPEETFAIVRPSREAFSPRVAIGFDGLQEEGGLHGCGGAMRVATELDRHLPGFQGHGSVFATAQMRA